MPCPEERPVSATRRRKEALLTQVCTLALAGQSCRQITATCGLPKSTVHRWLELLREDCPTRIANSAKIIAEAVAGYEALYHKALESFSRSQADKVTERIVETKTARGPKKKRTVVTVNQAGKPALLDAARRALDGIAKIAVRVAPRGGKEGEKGRGTPPRAARPGSPTGVLNAFRHQRKEHRPCDTSRMFASGAQRLSASTEGTPVRSRCRNTGLSVLNAFRHQRKEHTGCQAVSPGCAKVLNAFRHQRKEHRVTLIGWS